MQEKNLFSILYSKLYAVTKSTEDILIQFDSLAQNIYLEISVVFHIEPLLSLFTYEMAVALFSNILCSTLYCLGQICSFNIIILLFLAFKISVYFGDWDI